MIQKSLIAGAAFALILALVGYGTFFTVNERQTAFVLQFGEVKTVYTTPGLKMKIPFIQEVVKYDKRLQNSTLPAMEVTAGDQKRIVVDVFARYVITNPVRFYKTVQNIRNLNVRLDSIIARSMRHEIGQIPLTDLLSHARIEIMNKIHKEVRKAAEDFGINVKDVRIIRADLPKENSKAIFSRMESEREREAKFHIAEGEKAAKEIHAKTDREKAIILANAHQKARLIQGQGDAEATDIYGAATSKDPDFYDFYRSLEAYEASLDKDVTFVLSKDNKFFKHF